MAGNINENPIELPALSESTVADLLEKYGSDYRAVLAKIPGTAQPIAGALEKQATKVFKANPSNRFI